MAQMIIKISQATLQEYISDKVESNKRMLVLLVGLDRSLRWEQNLTQLAL